MPFPRELTTPPVTKMYLIAIDHLLTGSVFYRTTVVCQVMDLRPLNGVYFERNNGPTTGCVRVWGRVVKLHVWRAWRWAYCANANASPDDVDFDRRAVLHYTLHNKALFCSMKGAADENLGY